MIKISMDECAAYDALSILQLKEKNRGDVRGQLELLFREIQYDMYRYNLRIEDVLSSPEYLNLYKSNVGIFEAVDMAESDQITGKKLNDLNKVRFLCKKELQERFFPNNKLTEVKL